MSAFARIRRWSPRARRRRDAPPVGLVAADKLAARARRDAARAGTAVADGPDRELLARRDLLTERFALLQANLGGVFYEMAIRDHVRMDVLTRKAAELQRVDADLRRVDRELRATPGAPTPPAGSCPSCGAPHLSGARFCASCGQALADARASAAAGPAATPRAAQANGARGGAA